MFSDVSQGDHIRISLECESEEEINAVYEQLSSGGHVSVELQKTFWGAFHANLTDKNGIGWLLNYQENY